MSVLPIVARELRVAARKRSTFWLRIVAALVAFVIGSMVMVLSSGLGAGTAQMGTFLFGALTWLGLAVRMTSKNNNLATLKTVAFVQIIPWFLTTFASYMFTMVLMLPRLGFMSSGTSSQMMNWFPLLLIGSGAVLTLGKDAGFVLWSRSQLYANFREQATRGGRYERSAPLVPHSPLPPIIPARA
jgi:hypothetical protein